jgi:hypothetical protein
MAIVQFETKRIASNTFTTRRAESNTETAVVVLGCSATDGNVRIFTLDYLAKHLSC